MVHRMLTTAWAGLLAAAVAMPLPAVADDEGSSSDDSSSSSSSESGTAAAPAPVDDGDSSQDEGPSRQGVRSAIAADPDAVTVAHPVKRKSAGERAASAPAPFAAAASARRIALFLIPLGDNAGLAVAPTQLGLEGEVARLPGFHQVDLVKELTPPQPAAVVTKLDEARQAIEDGNKQLEEHQFSEAAKRYGHAVDLMTANASFVTPATLAEAMVRRAVALQFAGEDELARLAFRSAARIDLAKQVIGKNVDADLGSGLEHARKDLAAGPIGVLSVVTSPAGSRVFVGGVYKGATPITVEKLPAGPNFVLVDRPGAQTVARLVDVKEAQDTSLKLKMSFTPETIDLQNTLEQVPASLAREKILPDMVRALGRRFKLERCVIATVRMARTNIAEVRMVVFDLLREARLADEHAVFSVESETGLQADLATWARAVFDRADGSRDRAAADPLKRSDGTENWSAKSQESSAAPASTRPPVDSSAGSASARPAASSDSVAATEEHAATSRASERKKTSEKRKHGSGDSLDSKDGTEDW